MTIETLLSFLGASVLLTLMPGPDNIFVLTESITKGKKNGIAISIGLVSGVLIHTTIAATGLAIIIQKSDWLFDLIKYLGAIYLLYLAYLTFREPPPVLDLNNDDFDPNKKPEFSWFPLIRKGFFMNVLNPKVSLFFIAFLPSFISTEGESITIQMFILGIVFMIQALIIFSLLAILAGKLSDYLNRPQFWKITQTGKIAVLTILAIFLILSSK